MAACRSSTSDVTYPPTIIPLSTSIAPTELDIAPETPILGREITPKQSLQLDNPFLVTQFQPLRSSDLSDNRMGDMITLHPSIHTERPDELADRISEKGLKWMRLSYDVFDWNEVEQRGAYSIAAIDSVKDQAIATLSEEGIQIIYTLVFWDPDIDLTGDDFSRFSREQEIDAFLEYVRFIVGHLKGQIRYYALLNEPNIGEGSQQFVDVENYIALMEAVVPVIRSEDPEAGIIVGEVTPLNEAGAYDYLMAIITSPTIRLVDGISWHLSNGASPEYQADFYYRYPDLVREIQSVAKEHGFNGEYFGTEMHWRTSETPHTSEYWGYSLTTAAKYLARGIVTNLGLDCYAGLAENLEDPPKMRVIQNLSTLMDQAGALDIPVDLESDALNLITYGFIRPNGDRLLAIWQDTSAEDRLAGELVAISFSDTDIQKIIGFDVINGIQQEMLITFRDGKASMENVLVKDYPIIFLLKGVEAE